MAVNQWAARRKGVIFLFVIVCLIVIVGIPTYFAARHAPSCSNGIQDGDETGVDCGGSCKLLCTPQTLPIITLGDARLLKIATTTYVAAIVVENPNVNGFISRAPYTFSIYSGSSNKPLQVFAHDTYVGRNSTFALFTGPFEITGSGPFRATFEWGANLSWQKGSDPTSLISAENINLVTTSDGTPRLEATLTNKTQNEIDNVEAVAILSDTDGNTQAAGKTFVDVLAPNEPVPISFTWPAPFASTPVTIHIYPHALPDKSYVQ